MGAKQVHGRKGGFTLIELSIVLVIIGLIVGGVLVGQNLIAAAAMRATVTQIEKYNTATNAFRDKYNALPGDISANQVVSFGFQTAPTRGGVAGRGDGNGVLEGYNYPSSLVVDYVQGGETLFFWEDLSANAKMIEGAFATAGDYQLPNNTTLPAPYYPEAKLGGGNYIFVYSRNGTNFFSIANVSRMDASGDNYVTPGLTVAQALSIYTKVDDGLPQAGNVLAITTSATNGYFWAGGGGVEGAHSGVGVNHTPSTAATPGSATTCYDNQSTIGAVQQYSVEISGGSNVNCALSFRFQ